MSQKIVVPVQHFCCCIPVRYGTLALAFVLCVASFAQTINLFRQLFYLESFANWLATVLDLVVYLFVFFLAWHGWIGTYLRERKWIETFDWLLWGHTWASLFIGTGFVAVRCSQSEKLLWIQSCVSNEAMKPLPGLTKFATCRRVYVLSLILQALVWAIFILIQVWLSLVVAHYVDQVAAEEDAARGIDVYHGPPYPAAMSSIAFAKSRADRWGKSSRPFVSGGAAATSEAHSERKPRSQRRRSSSRNSRHSRAQSD